MTGRLAGSRPAGYQSKLDLHPDDSLTEYSDDGTPEERATVLEIRAQINPRFTVQQLRHNRRRALSDALRHASALEAAGLAHETDVHRDLISRLITVEQSDIETATTSL